LGQSDESDTITLLQTAHDLCAVPVGQADHHHARLHDFACSEHEDHGPLRPCSRRTASLAALTPLESALPVSASLPLAAGGVPSPTAAATPALCPGPATATTTLGSGLTTAIAATTAG
jgi:hypothetical protein